MSAMQGDQRDTIMYCQKLQNILGSLVEVCRLNVCIVLVAV